jgi:hypothetical protein
MGEGASLGRTKGTECSVSWLTHGYGREGAFSINGLSGCVEGTGPRATGIECWKGR